MVTVISFSVPIRPKPTPRPRAKKGQGAYYPKAYQSYKDELEWLVKQAWVKAGKPETTKPYSLFVAIYPGEFVVTLSNSTHSRHGVRGDIDNIQKGLIDAMQAVGMIDNDRNVHEVTIRFG